MFFSTQDTTDALKKYEGFANATVREISEHFIFLHGLLQNMENRAYLDLKQRTIAAIEHVNKLRATLTASNEKLKVGSYIYLFNFIYLSNQDMT